MKVKPRERVVLYGLKEIHQAGSIFILILASLREMALGIDGLLGAVYPQQIVNDLIAPSAHENLTKRIRGAIKSLTICWG